MVMGDVNDRLGNLVGDNVSNPAGDIWHQWCLEHELEILNSSPAASSGTFTWANSKSCSMIDYCAVSMNNNKVNIKSFDIDESPCHLSDHNPISITLNASKRT